MMAPTVYPCLFTKPCGRLVKIHAGPCMFAPGVLISIDARWARPGPRIHTRRCQHAASGCNYPEGDCAGLCLVAVPPKVA